MIFWMSVLLSSGLAFASGRTVGNGGDVVSCKGSDGTNSLELLDYYEGRVLRGLKVDLGGADVSIDEKLDLALTRLERVSPRRAASYRQQVKSFISETLFLDDVDLVDVPDSGHIILPKNCKILQIANQSEPLYPEDRRFVIDRTLWNQLDKDNQAGLILHEVVYREAISIGHVNSISARLLNSNMTSLRIILMSLQEYTEFLENLGFTTNNIQGIDVVLNDPKKENPFFSPEGVLKFAWVSPKATLDWENQKIHLRDSVEFDDAGHIKKVFLLGVQVVDWLGQLISLGPYEMTFFPDGKLRTVTVNDSLHWISAWADLVLTSSLRWSSTGNFYQGQVVRGQILRRDHWIEIKNFAVFHEAGMAREIELLAPQKIPWKGQNLGWQGRIELNANGDVINGFLDESTTDILTHGSKVSFKRYYPVIFFDDAHEVKSGCLGQRLYWPTPRGIPVKYEPGVIINWDKQGQIQIDPNKSC
jgi:hypothetical protein